MPNLKAIRKRITSVKATQKITRAMKMVAGARLNRAQQRILALRPYALKTQEVLQSVADSMREHAEDEAAKVDPHDPDELFHPLLEYRPEKKVLYVVMTGDRGLCGGFNANVNKATDRERKEREGGERAAEVEFATIGRKGREYLQRRGATVAQDFPGLYDGLNLEKARQVTHFIVSNFENGTYDAVYLVYNEFKSAISQKTTVDQLLPIPKSNSNGEKSDKADKGDALKAEFLYEPNPRALLERLVPMYMDISIYRALLETQAGFFGAQMTAMDAATRNAKDVIARLSLAYNRARQAAITTELMEIIGGAEALKD
ncbi:ATP synthase F1 subunit gamma [Pendulispora rubella]|uniref:ATP synthase gamma chain n=1 Tax=Pendulispora rubella TaxID=2741070 RepID=A0ABZ2KWY4_9BACT